MVVELADFVLLIVPMVAMVGQKRHAWLSRLAVVTHFWLVDHDFRSES